MNINFIESSFSSFLDRVWSLNNVAPFSLAYIRLLLLFGSNLSQIELSALIERQKQLRGEEYDNKTFDEMRNLTRRRVDSGLKNNSST